MFSLLELKLKRVNLSGANLSSHLSGTMLLVCRAIYSFSFFYGKEMVNKKLQKAL